MSGIMSDVELKKNTEISTNIRGAEDLPGNVFDPKQAPEVIKKKSNGINNGMILPDMAFLSNEEMGDVYETKIDKFRRNSDQMNRQTALGKKRVASERLERVIEKVRTERNENMRSLMEHNNTGITLKNWTDLSWFVNTDNSRYNKDLLSLYVGAEKIKSPREADENRKKALELVTMQLKEINVSGINLKDDAEIAANAEKLEKLTGMICAYDRLMLKTPGYLAELQEDEKRK